MRRTVLALALSLFIFTHELCAQLGPPPAGPPLGVMYTPPQPSRFHVWIDGYWAPFGNDYSWYPGYWIVPPYYAARWIPPSYDPVYDRYYFGFWDRDRLRRTRDFRPQQFRGSEYVITNDRFDDLLHRE